MTQLQVEMAFACVRCEENVFLTVACTGKGLQAGSRSVAAISVACPHCHQGNQVLFHPTGEIKDVRAVVAMTRLPIPSVN